MELLPASFNTRREAQTQDRKHLFFNFLFSLPNYHFSFDLDTDGISGVGIIFAKFQNKLEVVMLIDVGEFFSLRICNRPFPKDVIK